MVVRSYAPGLQAQSNPAVPTITPPAAARRSRAPARRERPDAIFTHGPDERHRDHRAVAEIVPEAAWQAGEPVSAELGEPWRTRHVFYYRGVEGRPPDIVCDVSDFEHKRYEALATQVSQHTLFGKTREEFLEEAERVREAVRKGAKFTENFWIVPNFPISGFPDA